MMHSTYIVKVNFASERSSLIAKLVLLNNHTITLKDGIFIHNNSFVIKSITFNTALLTSILPVDDIEGNNYLDKISPTEFINKKNILNDNISREETLKSIIQDVSVPKQNEIESFNEKSSCCADSISNPKDITKSFTFDILEKRNLSKDIYTRNAERLFLIEFIRREREYLFNIIKLVNKISERKIDSIITYDPLVNIIDEIFSIINKETKDHTIEVFKSEDLKNDTDEEINIFSDLFDNECESSYHIINKVNLSSVINEKILKDKITDFKPLKYPSRSTNIILSSNNLLKKVLSKKEIYFIIPIIMLSLYLCPTIIAVILIIILM